MNAPLSDQEGNEITVRVSLQSIYSKLLEMETKLTNVPETLRDHEARLRLLERRVWMVAGIGVAVAWLGPWLIERLEGR